MRQIALASHTLQDEPIITEDYDGTDFTCISFTPDWGRFHMIGMEADTIALLRKVPAFVVVVTGWLQALMRALLMPFSTLST